MRAGHSARLRQGPGAAEGIRLTAAELWDRLGGELTDVLPSDAAASLLGSPPGDLHRASSVLADAGVRGLPALAFPQAAGDLAALPPVVDAGSARRAMVGLERLARRLDLPNALVRAAGGAGACLVALQGVTGDAEDRALDQLVAAVVRVASLTRRAGVPAAAVLGALTGRA